MNTEIDARARQIRLIAVGNEPCGLDFDMRERLVTTCDSWLDRREPDARAYIERIEVTRTPTISCPHCGSILRRHRRLLQVTS